MDPDPVFALFAHAVTHVQLCISQACALIRLPVPVCPDDTHPCYCTAGVQQRQPRGHRWKHSTSGILWDRTMNAALVY
jgi:hypothetical protein